MVSIACIQLKELGLAAELWRLSALARYVCEHAESVGFPRLARAGKSTVWRILDENELKPHKIRYYLEKPAPDFDRKMREVLIAYRDVSLYAEASLQDGANPVYTVSVDEKSGVQAIGLTAPDLPPVPGKAPTVSRDYEYIRHGTVAANSLRCSGRSMPTTRRRPSSVSFWITIRRTSPRKPWLIWPRGPGGLSTFTPPNTVPDST